MIRLLLFIAVLVSFSKADEEQNNDVLSSFLEWSSHYIPHVKDPMRHYQTWKETWNYVQEHNGNHSSGLVSYSLSMNQFALQMDPHILTQTHNQLIPDDRNEEFEYPFDVDWRTKGVITPVQYDGCSQVLALVDAVNSAVAIKTGHLVPFSAEEVSDCCFGCICDPGPQQADPPTVCVKRNGGLCRDIDYPYTTNMCMCHQCNDGSVRQPVQDYHNIANGSEKDLAIALKKQPVIVAIDSSDPSLKLYKSGIYSSKNCSAIHLDHMLLLVGYGSKDGQDYWLCKNCWGEGWGMKGYVLIARNKNNMCGIASKASYPIV